MQAQILGIKIKFETLERDKDVMIDFLRTQQILINLLQNSIKFSRKNDTIRVNVSYYQVENPLSNIGCVISVTDQGIGISDADKLNLFKPYFKTQDERSKKINKQSHGIGLSFCKQIAKRLGGDLKLNEEVTYGCQF